MSYNPATLTNFYRKCICPADSDNSNNASISATFGFCPTSSTYTRPVANLTTATTSTSATRNTNPHHTPRTYSTFRRKTLRVLTFYSG